MVILLSEDIECTLSKHITYHTFGSASVVATSIHLGYVSLFVAFITLLVLVSAIIWGMFASTAVAWSFSRLSGDLVCATMC